MIRSAIADRVVLASAVTAAMRMRRRAFLQEQGSEEAGGGYSVSADGQRFLLNPTATGPTPPAPPITTVINWTTALKK